MSVLARRPGAASSGRGVTLATGHRSSRGATLLFAATIMVATLMAVLLLNIARSRGSYEDERLTARQSSLAQEQQALTEALRASSAPGALAARAQALGMVADPAPGYLRLSDGAVLGDPAPAASPNPVAGAGAAPSAAPAPPAATASSSP